VAKRQDKICDMLTLLGLLAVIAVGTSSLLPATPAEEGAEEETVETATPQPALEETVEEVPMREDPPVAEEQTAEPVAIDTLAAVPAPVSPADTLEEHAPCRYANGGNASRPRIFHKRQRGRVSLKPQRPIYQFTGRRCGFCFPYETVSNSKRMPATKWLKASALDSMCMKRLS